MDNWSPSLDFSVVIPAYNEAAAIRGVLERLLSVLGDGSTGGRKFEVLVVDDGSTDDTYAEVRAVSDSIRILRHPYNLGNGAAIKTGIRNACGEVLVFMDADGQHDPEIITQMVDACDEYDMVVGARDKKSQAGLHRRLANVLYNQLASYVTSRRVMDLTSGFRALRSSVARMFVGLLPNGYSYPSTITLCVMRAGFSVYYTPIVAAKRKGKSKIRLFSDGTKFLLVIMKISMLFSPMKIFLPVSVYLFLMGLGYYAHTYFSEQRFTNMSMLLFTTAVMVFMMGLVAEQVAQMRSERDSNN